MRKFLIHILFVLQISILFGDYAYPQEKPIRNILIFHSYHPNFAWTEDIQNAILDELQSEKNLNIFFEFMDARRFGRTGYFDVLKRFFHFKYQDRPYDAIICTDDFAIQFMIQHRDDMFPGVPVVFCGLNRYAAIQDDNLTKIPENMNITGIAESADVDGTVDIALKIRPNPDRITIIHNGDGNDSRNQQYLESYLGHQEKINILIDKDPGEIKEYLQSCSQNELIFFLSIPSEWDITKKDEEAVIRKCKAPIFTLWSHFLGHGFFGGLAVNANQQGQYAARMAKRILNGEKANDIPIQWKSPNHYIFDYQQMRLLGFNKNDFPKDSHFINENRDFYSQYFYWIWGTGLFIVLQMAFLLILFVNLHRRKKAEKLLRISESRLSLALNAANEGLWDFNPHDGIVHYFSPKWYTMLGYEPYEFPQSYQTFLQLLHPADVKETEEKILDAVESRNEFNIEFRMKTKSNGYRWILSRGQIIEHNKDGSAVRMVGTHVDITEQKELEEYLRQSQKMETVGMLAGGIAHDFNNLLTSVIGYSDLSLNLLDSSHPIHKYIREISKAGDRATMLTRQLLAFSRRQILEPKVIHLNELTANMNPMLRRLIGESIEYVNIPGTPLNCIKADPGQMEQVLMNLVVNARDAMPGGGKITIETQDIYVDKQFARKHHEMEPGDYVMLSVSDTGCGIDPETCKRIFDPFFTTKEKGKGTGLGLSMAYGIIKQSGGHIFVNSEVGQGTVFTIYLPQTDEDLPARIEDGQHHIHYNGTETLLVVEDEEMVRNLTVRVLEEHGYTVFSCSYGDEALQFCHGNQTIIHLLVTDVVMPNMSGRVLAEKLTSQRPDMKVLFMSGYTNSAIVQDGKLEEGIHFLQKPFAPNALLQKVRGILDTPALHSHF